MAVRSLNTLLINQGIKIIIPNSKYISLYVNENYSKLLHAAFSPASVAVENAMWRLNPPV